MQANKEPTKKYISDRKWVAKNREKVRKISRRWYAKNKEKESARKRAYYEKTKEALRLVRAERSRKNYHADKEKSHRRTKRWRANNKPKLLAYFRENKENLYEQRRKRFKEKSKDEKFRKACSEQVKKWRFNNVPHSGFRKAIRSLRDGIITVDEFNKFVSERLATADKIVNSKRIKRGVSNV